MTIKAIYEHGVLRPIEPLDLPEQAEVELDIRREPVLKEWDEMTPEEQSQLDAIYEVLSRRYSSGDPYGSERHNEHQP